MADERVVPIWTLSSGGSDDALVERLHDSELELTRDRLARLRVALAALSDDPPVVLERHVVAHQSVPAGGRLVAAGSPLAKSIADIVGSTRQLAPAEAAAGGTEVLYRMVVPEKLAGQLAQGTVRQMSAGGDAVYSAIRGKSSIVGNAKFMPVVSGGGVAGGAAAVGTGAAGAAGVGAAVIAAAPVVLLLAATAGSIYAEEQRRHALKRVEDMLNKLTADELDKELDELNGAISAITKATALLADEGRLGMSLGLDSAVNRIDTAVSRAERRVSEWERKLAAFGGKATPDALRKAFPGLGGSRGEFEAKLRMAGFAMAMKRRVAILQAAEHTHNDSGLSLSRFNRELAKDTADLAQLEQRVAGLLAGIADLKIKAPEGRRHVMFMPKEVKDLLSWSPYLQAFSDRESPVERSPGDLELCFVVQPDGELRVLGPVPDPVGAPPTYQAEASINAGGTP